MAMKIETKGLDELNYMLSKLGGEAMNVATWRTHHRGRDATVILSPCLRC